MISPEQFQAGYLDYAARNRLWGFLEATHSHEELNELMLLILESEERILQCFGLPATQSNSSLLQLSSLQEDFGLVRVTELYEALKEEAETYLSANVLTDLQLLEVAQKWGLSIDEVLPQTSMKLTAEAYYHFLYAEYFLPGTICASAYLKEIRIVAENNLAARLFRLFKDPLAEQSAEFKLLSGCGLVYLSDFLAGYAKFEEDYLRAVELESR